MPEDFGADISAAEQMVRQWQERAAEKAAKFGQMQQQIEQISATESSRDGAIRVTVGSNGILRELDLSEKAGNRPMSQLSADIMRLVQTAQSKIPELMQQAVADTVGLEDSAAQHLLGEARKNFPEAPQDEEPDRRTTGVQEMRFDTDDYEPPQRRRQPPAPPQRPSRRRNDFDDDEDFSSGSFLR